MTKTSLQQWLRDSITLLEGKSDFPTIETQVLLSYVSGLRKEQILMHPDQLLSEDQLGHLNILRQKLLQGVPLPYLVNKQSFYGLDFYVNSSVLIPRPETELLVEECITWLEEHPNKRNIVDVGTGSGIIAITLADQFPDLKVTAIDISTEALAVARINAEKYQVIDRIQFLQNDLLAEIDAKYDLIAANLPYIPTEKLNSLQVSHYEPHLALDGGEDGLKLIRKLLDQSKNHVRSGGMIILEIESDQGDESAQIGRSFFPNSKIATLNDLAKHPRITKILV